MSNRLAFRFRRGHPIDKPPDVVGKIQVAILRKETGNGATTVLDLAPCVNQCALTGFGAVVSLEQFGRDGFGLCADVGRVSPKTGSVDSVLLGLSSLATNRALGGVGFNAKQPQMVEELLIDPLRERLAGDGSLVSALRAWLAQRERTQELQWGEAMKTPDSSAGNAPVSDPAADAALAAKLEALEAAQRAGVLTAREAADRASAFQVEHNRAQAGRLPGGDSAAILADAEALQAALETGITDALRDALRRVIGEVRLKPVADDGPRYLNAVFSGGNMPLLDWLAVGEPGTDKAQVVAGVGFEPTTFGL